jgi:hypothetical protein
MDSQQTNPPNVQVNAATALDILYFFDFVEPPGSDSKKKKKRGEKGGPLLKICKRCS